MFFRLIAEAGPRRASVITYVNPLVAAVMGVFSPFGHLTKQTDTRAIPGAPC